MDGIGGGGVEAPLHLLAAAQRKPDFAIARTGKIAEQVGRDELDRMPARAQQLHGCAERSHHAIDLRMPSVARQDDPHAGTTVRPAATPPRA